MLACFFQPQWLRDPLREAAAGKPDVGALPFGAGPWGVGVDGRVPLFGGPPGK